MKYKKKKSYLKDQKETYVCPNCCASNSTSADFCTKCDTPIGFMNTTDPAKQISKISTVKKGFLGRFSRSNKDRDIEMEIIITLSLILLACLGISIYSLTR